MRLIGLICLLLTLVACSKSDDKPSNTQSSSATVIVSSSTAVSSSTSSSANSISSTSNSSAAAYTLDSHDWGQTVITNNTKLIPNKSALLRLHILHSQTTPVPDIQVEAVLNTTTTLLTVTKPTQLPAVKNVDATNQSFRTIVDKSLMQPGLSIRVTISGVTQIITPVFGIENKLYITLVPIRITTASGTVTTGTIPNLQTIRNGFLQLWPFSEVNLQTRAVYTSAAKTADDMEDVLTEIAELRDLDLDRSHYYGFFSDDVYNLLNFDGFGGIAYLSSTAGIGSDRDPGLSIMLHEVGHNFSLQHINCGDPVEYDSLYPHNTDSIGTLGVNASFSMFYQPTSYRDIMSYCSPEFVSDYSYKKAQNYLEQNPSRIFRSTTLQKTAASTEPSWFISGQILADNSVKLRRLIPITRESTLQVNGQYQLVITDPLGNRHTQFFDTLELDHANQNSARFFSLYIPHTEIQKLEIYQANNLLFSQTESPAQAKSTSAVQLKKTTSGSPLVSQANNQICLQWDNQHYDSATLILTQDEGQTTLFMDTRENQYCVDFPLPPDANKWQILLRKGLDVDEYWQNVEPQ
jgi:Peptidase M66